MRKGESVLIAMAIALAMAGLGGLTLVSARGEFPAASRRPAPPIPQRSAGRRCSESRNLDYVGVALPERSADVSASRQGKVTRTFVRLGDHVREGDVLLTMDVAIEARELALARADLDQALADERRARLELAQTSAQLSRRESLEATTSALSEEEQEAAHYRQRAASVQLAASRAGVKQRRVRIERAQAALSQLSVTSPFEGVVALVLAQPGEVVAVGAPLLRVVSDQRVRVRFAVESSAAAELREGTEVSVLLPDKAVLKARVERSAPELEVFSHTLFVEAVLAEPRPRGLPFGAELRVRIGDRPQADCDGKPDVEEPRT